MNNIKLTGIKRFRRIESFWIFVIPSLGLLALLVLPLLALILRSVNPHAAEDAFSKQALQALTLSLVTSSITVMIAAALGTPLAYIMSLWKSNHRTWLEVLLDLPIVLPPSVAGLALLLAFGRNGLLGSQLEFAGIHLPFSSAAVVLAQTFVAAPLFVRSARVGFSHVDREVVEAARVEGANQWQLFTEIMIPLAGRALASGAMITWMRALGEFGATILFAGNLQGVTQTMPMAIYLGFESNLGVAMVLSVILIMISILILAATKRLENQTY
jgi:molybdate transport system permease protein